MSKAYRTFAVVLLVFALSLSPAWGAEPQDALSGRPAAFYTAFRVNDVGGILRAFLSPANIELLTSLASPSEAQGIRLVGSYVSRIPVKSLAVLVGAGSVEDIAGADSAEDFFFFQAAASMPEEMRGKLSLIAEGKAGQEELTSLLLGDDSPLLAVTMPSAVLQQGKQGSYYALQGTPLKISAKDDLLLFTFSPEDMDASKEALGNADKRLALKRRFESPNYWAFHADMSIVQKLAEATGESDKELELLMKYFKAPLDVEIGFEANPDNFLLSGAMNILESVTTAEHLKNLKPVQGGGLFSAGGGRPYFGLGALLNFDPDELEVFPEAAAAWNSLVQTLEREKISVDAVKNLLKGSFSITTGGSAQILGMPLPGLSISLTGRNGAAGTLMKNLLDKDQFIAAVPLSPLKANGWDMLFQVDPAIFPMAPILLGVKGETLFLAFLDPGEINKKPDFSPQVAALFSKDSFAAGFLDIPVLWAHLKRAIQDESRIFDKAFNAGADPFLKAILEGDSPIGLIELWAPTIETSFLRFNIVDVPPEKSILPRIVNALKVYFSDEDDDDSGISFDSEEAQPLILLMVAKGAIEEVLAADPGAKLDVIREDLSDFAVILETDSGEIYVGTEVTGEEQKILRGQAEQFGLLGSANLGIAPNGTPYDGQEAAWLKIDLPEAE